MIKEITNGYLQFVASLSPYEITSNYFNFINVVVYF